METLAIPEMEKNSASLKLRRDLYHSVTPASYNMYESGDKVLITKGKEVNNRMGEWIRSFTVDSMDYRKKHIFLRIPSSKESKQ